MTTKTVEYKNQFVCMKETRHMLRVVLLRLEHRPRRQIYIFFKIKTGKITRGHDFTLVKGQNRLDFRKYSFSQRTVNEWNKLSADCVHSSSVNMFKNRIDKYLVRAGYT